MYREVFENMTFVHLDHRAFDPFVVFITAMQQFQIKHQRSADMPVNGPNANIVVEGAEAWPFEGNLKWAFMQNLAGLTDDLDLAGD